MLHSQSTAVSVMVLDCFLLADVSPMRMNFRDLVDTKEREWVFFFRFFFPFFFRVTAEIVAARLETQRRPRSQREAAVDKHARGFERLQGHNAQLPRNGHLTQCTPNPNLNEKS